MPAPLGPGTAQKNSYVPGLRVTFSWAVWPPEMVAVGPASTPLPSISRLWGTLEALVRTQVAAPAGAVRLFCTKASMPLGSAATFTVAFAGAAPVVPVVPGAVPVVAGA